MIDFSRFTQIYDEIVPIINKQGQINSRKISANLDDGWYRVRVGSKLEVLGKATPLEVFKTLQNKKFLRVYALGLEGIPTNFDNFFRKGFGEAIKVYFLNLSLFEVAKVVLWEDKRFYFYEADAKYERENLRTLKEKFDKDEPTKGIKGITPELSYYLLLVNLERQAFREVDKLKSFNLSDKELQRRVEQFKNSFEDRIKKTVEEAGGELVKFTKANADAYLVEWKVGGQVVKSTIRDDLGILNAGFCLSGDDRKHSMSSIIQLAKEFQEDDPLYITRD